MTKQLRTQEFNDDDLKWQVIASENIIHRPHLDAYKEKVELPNGTAYDEFYHLHFSSVVCIVAETTDGKLLIERQYRHAVRSVITEIPAGIVEPGEEPLAAAKRELQEETATPADNGRSFRKSMLKEVCKTILCMDFMPKT